LHAKDAENWYGFSAGYATCKAWHDDFEVKREENVQAWKKILGQVPRPFLLSRFPQRDGIYDWVGQTFNLELIKLFQ
jgi:hypothetical protein